MTSNMGIFLKEDPYVDYSSPVIVEKAKQLFGEFSSDMDKAKIAFEFVRDEIPHSFNINEDIITAKASDVLKYGTGICHAKANLLAALLRSQNIPTGFCFQHITLDDDDALGYCVHCYNAVFLEERWIKLDAQGNTNGLNAQFSMDKPLLAFINRKEYDEYFWEGIYADPHRDTMRMLDKAVSIQEIIENIPDYLVELPDILEEPYDNTGTTAISRPVALPEPQGKPKYVAVTFDDGPNLTITPIILDILEKYDVKATFFLIGQYINEDTKAVMERQVRLGCEICNHSWSHLHMDTLSAAQIAEEVSKTSTCIYETVGVIPAFFRPPYIDVNDTMFEEIALPFVCGINCNDWVAAVTPQKRVKTILNHVKDGDIILLHDFEENHNTVEALGTMLQGLLRKGYTLVTVSELFRYKGVEPDVKYTMWSNTDMPSVFKE